MLPPVSWAGASAYGSASDAELIGGGPTPVGVVMPQPALLPQPVQPMLNTVVPTPQTPAPIAQPASMADIQTALTNLVGALQKLVGVLQAQQGAGGVQGGGGAMAGCTCHGGGGGVSQSPGQAGGAQAAPDAGKPQEATADSKKAPRQSGGGGGGGGGGGSTGATSTKPASITGAAQKQSGETKYDGLQPKSLAVLNAAHDYGLKLISGLRPGETQGHGNGSAVDVSNVKGGSRDASREMEAYAEAMRAAGKAGDPNVGYVIYRQRIASARENWAWRPMEDRGSNTQNHFDHVHVSTDPNR